jgi:hypothetical protein
MIHLRFYVIKLTIDENQPVTTVVGDFTVVRKIEIHLYDFDRRCGFADDNNYFEGIRN